MTDISTAHDSHRRARSALTAFFSRAGITRVEPRVVARVRKLCDRLKVLQDSGTVVNLTNAFSSLTTGTSKVVMATKSVPNSHCVYGRRYFLDHLRGTQRLPW